MNWKNMLPIKKARKKKKKSKSRLKLRAEYLNRHLPKSEQWFQELWSPHKSNSKLTAFKDVYNEPLGKFIPDVLNRGYKYIIEIDGSIHNLVEQKYQDELKNLYYKNLGYTVFRVRAYNKTDFEQVLHQILQMRNIKNIKFFKTLPL